ncbi:DUF4148 domain-containing protein [Pulveribacter sp.]|uniref:DUF4148 domain-containing protein n=1 Tax=Pulveribacter sp. TaxID=2678893 RepID=UPI00289B8B30|nr:DUF4148 domain-containing protein [Pulveribacter sp.]
MKTMITVRNTLSAIALAGTALALPAMATESQEAWGNQAVQMQAQSGSAVSRAEVLADLSLWRRAGLEALSTGEAGPVGGPQYQQRMAEYQRLRGGPAYLAEVRRFGGDASDVAAYGSQRQAY